ncbi:hypothetical protein ACIQ62_03880 [Streptomyces sp. NPDC096319]|uniref:hypothetical protein n=1 Tax=Streptomyces sp. NPDC096319 TaxID=3366084 RepID=UPI0038219A4A
MLRSKVFTALAAIALSLLALPATSASTESADVQTGKSSTLVEYKGSEVALDALEDKVGETHCHDAKGQGQLTCFATEREADLDLLAKGGLPAETAKATARKWRVAVPKQVSPTLAAAAATCHPYVTVRFYDGNNATGSSVNLYCDYPDLSQVGWNDRANSMVCMVCKNIATGASQYNAKNLVAFQNANMQIQAASAQYSTMMNIRANVTSSNRLYFY